MATIVITKASERELKAQGIKSAQKVEWWKVVAASSTTAEGATGSFTDIKNCNGVISAGPFSNSINNSTKQVTLTPVATCSGTFFVGLLGGITE